MNTGEERFNAALEVLSYLNIIDWTNKKEIIFIIALKLENPMRYNNI